MSTININSSGFRLNPAFVREHSIKKFPYAEIFYDQAKSSIAFHFEKEFVTDAVRIHIFEDAGIIQSRTVFTSFGLDPTTIKGRYDPMS